MTAGLLIYAGLCGLTSLVVATLALNHLRETRRDGRAEKEHAARLRLIDMRVRAEQAAFAEDMHTAVFASTLEAIRDLPELGYDPERLGS